MHALDMARVIPEGSARYRAVSLEEHGPHWFRGPTFSAAGCLRRLIEHARNAARHDPESIAFFEEMSPVYGAVVGALWWHESIGLDAKRPRWDEDARPWLDFGEAVCDELVEQGYTLLHLMALVGAALSLVNEQSVVIAEARERADFSSEPGESAAPKAPPDGAAQAI